VNLLAHASIHPDGCPVESTVEYKYYISIC